MGEALLEGRVMYPANQAFGAWCVNEGFDMDRRERADAMWLTENWAALSGFPTPGLSSPGDMRKAHRDLQATQAPSPDLDISAPADVALERIAKVAPNARRVMYMAPN